MDRKTSPLDQLVTSHGVISFPAYIPVTTFGNRYPLDNLVRPYLRRLASAVMVSYHYAQEIKEHPGLPLLIDSGGFASLFQDAVVKKSGGLGVLERHGEEEVETLDPKRVLEFQEEHADVAFTLDFPVPPNMNKKEGRRRLDLTIANAHWAIENRRRKKMRIYACVQGWDVDSYRECAGSFAGSGFDGAAIGGLVPRMGDPANLMAIVEAVRLELPDLPLHVFGIGKPELVSKLFEAGVQSVDSSSYVKQAADGKLWGQTGTAIQGASSPERLHLALCNLATATSTTLPLSSSQVVFSTRRLFGT